jgi:type IVB pilus formation R64 PilN family outer membrane protein
MRMKFLVSVGLSIMVSGCGIQTALVKNIEADRIQTSKAFDQMDTQRETYRGTSLQDRISPEAFVAEQGVRRMDPTIAGMLDKTISLATKGEVNLREFASDLENIIHIPVIISDDVDMPSKKDGPAAALAVGAVGGAIPLPGMGMTSSGGASGFEAGGSSRASDRRMAWKWNGSASALLDFVTARYGVDWSFEADGGLIRISRFRTQTFTLLARPDIQDSTRTVKGQSGIQTVSGGGGMGGGGGGGDKNETSRKVVYDAWKSIDQTLAKLISSDDGNFITQPSLSTVVVTTTKPKMKEIADYFYHLNERLSRQVNIEISVFQVTENIGATAGFDPTLIYSDLQKAFAASIGLGISNVATNAGSLALGVVAGSNTPNNTLREIGGTNVILKALQTRGNARLASKLTLTARNLQITERSDYVEQTFQQNIGSTQTGISGGSQTTGVTGQFTTGYSYAVRPVILNNGSVQIDFYLNAKTLLALETFNVAPGQTVQQPKIATTTVPLDLIVKDGDMIIASTLMTSNDTVDQRGIASPQWIVPAGGSTSATAKSMMLVFLRPVVITERVTQDVSGYGGMIRSVF